MNPMNKLFFCLILLVNVSTHPMFYQSSSIEDQFLSALFLIRHNSFKAFQEMLQKSDFLPQYQNKYKNTLLHCCILYAIECHQTHNKTGLENSEYFVRGILMSGTDPNIINQDNKTALAILLEYISALPHVPNPLRAIVFLLLIFGTPFPLQYGAFIKKILQFDVAIETTKNSLVIQSLISPDTLEENLTHATKNSNNLLLAIGQGLADVVRSLLKNRNILKVTRFVSAYNLIHIIYTHHIIMPEELQKNYYKIQMMFLFPDE